MDIAFAFDTLAYAKRLRENGVSQEQAEAHAEAVRDYVIQEVATKTDLQATADNLRSELRADIRASEQNLRLAMEQLALRLTIMIGVAAAASVGAMAAIVKLT